MEDREPDMHRTTWAGGSKLSKERCYYQDECNTYNDIASPSRTSIFEHESSASSCDTGREEKGNGKSFSEPKWTIVLGSSMVAILVTGCLRRGLFNSVDIYPVILMTGAIALISLVMYVGVMLGRTRDGLVSVRPGSARLGVMNFALAGFPLAVMLCYTVHAWAGSVSTQGSIYEMLRWSLLAMFALLAALLAASKGGVHWLALGWKLAGGILVLSGIFAVCGVLPLPFGVMRTADPEISSAGARLGGLLQYPNAYGAVVGMYALERLTAAAGVLAGRVVPARRLFAAVLPLMPAQAALLLSESRGAWLAAGCAVAAAVAQQRRGARLPLLLALAAPLACAAWLYRQLAAAQLAPAPVPGLLALAGAWAAALLGTLLLCRLWHSGGPAGRATALAATVLACIAAALMAAASTAERFAAGVGTGASRLQMWRDALRLWTEAAWLGHGGETWRTMFRAIQSSPYVGGEVHSGLLDLALDTGLLGIALIAGWMLFTLRSIRRFAPRLLPPVLVFVLHGIVDFDWSYALSWMLFIWLTAWALARRTEAETSSRQQSTHRSISNVFLDPDQFGKSAYMIKKKAYDAQTAIRPHQSQHYWHHLVIPAIYSRLLHVCTCVHTYISIYICRYICTYILICIRACNCTYIRIRMPVHIKRYTFAILLACWLGVTLGNTARYAWADMLYRHALTKQMDTTASVQHLRSAYRLNPTRPELAISLARTLPQTEATSILRNSLSHSPKDPDLYLQLGRLASQSGEGEQAGQYFITAIALNRYDNETQRTALYRMERLAMREISRGHVLHAQKAAFIGIQIHEHYRELAAQVNAEYMRNDRRFVLHDSASLTVENLRRIAANQQTLK